MKKKRERLDIIYDMLKNIRAKQRLGPTRLLQVSNLSPQMFKDYLNELLEAGLIIEETKDNRKFYVMSDKGCRFLEHFRNFSEFINQLGL